jgi:hypothetical protein
MLLWLRSPCSLKRTFLGGLVAVSDVERTWRALPRLVKRHEDGFRRHIESWRGKLGASVEMSVAERKGQNESSAV